MDRHVRYHDDFDSDLINSAEWYSNRDRQLAIDFTLRVETAVNELIADPERRSAVDYGLRYWPVERFPHIVFYDFDDKELIVLGVMHTSQEPHEWIARNA